jgi:tetratricopeptide (TPR) repeat protein
MLFYTSTHVRSITITCTVVLLVLTNGAAQENHHAYLGSQLLNEAESITRTLPHNDEEYDLDIRGNAQDVRSTQARVAQALAGAYARTGDIQGALRAAEIVEYEPWRDHAYREIVTAQLSNGQLDEAERLAMTTFTNASFLDMALADIAMAYAGIGDPERALKILPDYGHGKAFHLLQLALLQEAVGKSEEAFNTFQQALQVAEQAGSRKSFESTNKEHLLTLEVHSGRTQEALEHASGLDSRRKPGYLGRIAEGEAEQGHHDVAKKILSDALELARAMKPGTDRDLSFAQIAKSKTRSGDLTGGLRTVGLIKDATMADTAHIWIVEELARSGDVRGARKTIDLIRSKVLRDSARESMATIQAARHNIKGALETVTTIKSNKFRSRSLIAVASVPASSQWWHSALKHLDEIEAGPLQTLAVQVLAAAQTRAGGQKKAIAWANEQQDAHMKARALIGIADGLAFRPGENSGTFRGQPN